MATAKKKHDDGNDRLRETILDAALKHVPFEGWSLNALQVGAEDAGLERAAAHQAFPGGAMDMICAWIASTDAQMKAAFAAQGVEIARVFPAWPTVSRITIGSRQEMEGFIAACGKVLSA